MDFTQLISVLQGVAAVVQQAAPMAAVGGPQAAAIGKLVGAGAQFAQEALAHAQDTLTVIGADDLATIQGLATVIQAENDQLAEQIAAS